MMEWFHSTLSGVAGGVLSLLLWEAGSRCGNAVAAGARYLAMRRGTRVVEHSTLSDRSIPRPA